jgi:hypothetical protein
METKMQETDKKQFWVMVNVSMDLTNHPPLTKEAIVAWWHKLKGHEFGTVQAAFDRWLDNSSKSPTPKDILDLCKPREDFYVAIGKTPDSEVNKEGLKKIETFVAKNTKPKTDYRHWAKRIMQNPDKFPDSSVTAAKEALKLPEVK